MIPLIAAASGIATPVRESQNGMKYKTICAACNSLLGRKYDPTRIAFSRWVARYMNASVVMPTTVRWPVKVQRLMKAVLGHLLAAQVECPSPTLNPTVQNCVLEPSQPLPDWINLFFWLHRRSGPVGIPDLLKWSRRESALYRLDVLKFCPLGFVVTQSTAFDDLPNLSRYRHAGADEEVHIPVPLGSQRPDDWPEMSGDCDGTYTVIGQAAANAIFASAR